MVCCSNLFQNFPQFLVIHTVKGFGIVKKAEIDVFLELSCFFDDPADVGNVISGSSVFFKTSLNIWKFTVQLSHPYMTTGKTIALTRWTFVGKVMSLLLNMLSRLVITFLPRSKRLLISWLQSPSAVILEPPKTQSQTLFPHLLAMK